jgi:cyclic GMP-AMP synthase DncV-like protein
MADLQRYFVEFNDTIRLAPYDENEQLREKRDLLLKELRANLGQDVPAFRPFNQGSYAMNTGTIPKDGNYDIDVGLVFQCDRERYPDPLELKRLVLAALKRPNRTVRIRRPCVTVEYMKDGEVDYHVDLAIYVERRDGNGLDLAVGRESCAREQRRWEHNDPEGLIEKINKRYGGEEAAQMRRSIRYSKRWRDQRFPNGDGPISVALTVAAYHWFAPQLDLFSKKPIDAKALKHFITTMLGQFQPHFSDGQLVYRLAVLSPVAPFNDLLGDLTDVQMTALRERLQTLEGKLQQAIDEPLPETACQILRSQFGPEFPVPTSGDTAKTVAAPYVHAGQSA